MARATWCWLALVAALPASAGPPQLKEGLWDVQGQSVEKPANKTANFAYKLCRDHARDKAANAAVKDVPGCRTVVKAQSDGSYASASSCTVAGITIISNGITTYRRKEATHSETQAKYSPAFNGKTDETMTEDQHYLGPCPRAMKPGDTLAADGIIRHHD